MINFNKKYLEFNEIDGRWKVVDNKGFPFGDGKTQTEAVASARIVTNDAIYFGNTIFEKATDIEVNFKVVSPFDKTIFEEGVLNTAEADDERPINWLYYGLTKLFPNNPFDPYIQRSQYNTHQKLRKAVLDDDLLIQTLCDYADEDIVVEKKGYSLVINEGPYDDD